MMIKNGFFTSLTQTLLYIDMAFAIFLVFAIFDVFAH